MVEDWVVDVPAGVKKLAVTLAYNDQPDEAGNLKVDLTLKGPLPSTDSDEARHHKATDVTGQSPLEKMVIQNPEAGEWGITVRLTDVPGMHPLLLLPEVSHRYGLVASVIYKEPALAMTIPQEHQTINVNVGQGFTVTPTITNTGGYIAAGVTATASYSDRAPLLSGRVLLESLPPQPPRLGFACVEG